MDQALGSASWLPSVSSVARGKVIDEVPQSSLPRGISPRMAFRPNCQSIVCSPPLAKCASFVASRCRARSQLLGTSDAYNTR